MYVKTENKVVNNNKSKTGIFKFFLFFLHSFKYEFMYQVRGTQVLLLASWPPCKFQNPLLPHKKTQHGKEKTLEKNAGGIKM